MTEYRSDIKLLQVNLHHAKAASDVLSRRFIRGSIDIALLQEPWVLGSQVKGLPTKQGKLIYNKNHATPRVAMLFKPNINFLPITELISRDLVAALVEVPTDKGKHEVVIASAYFPGDTDLPPPEEITKLLDFCKKRNKSYIIGCDANAHHTVWGSSDTNRRGEYLFDYLVKNNIDIANIGNEPTFCNAIRQEVLDLTLISPNMADGIANWHVSNEASMSDHNHIRFDIKASPMQREETRVPRLTDWNSYREYIKMGLEELDNRQIESCKDLDLISSQMHRLIICSYEQSCPVKQREATRVVPWWNRELDRLRANSRRLFNKAKKTGAWCEYKHALTEYNKELRKSKRRTWRSFCEGIDDLPTSARLQKVLAKDHTNGIGLLQKVDGGYTSSREETVRLLLQTHFPESIIIQDNDEDPEELRPECRPSNRVKSLSGRIFTPRKVKWAVSSFKPFKSPGADGIFPALLQQGIEELLPNLIKTFRASYTLGYIPRMWRDVKVAFIPKGGGRSPAQPKSYRPISLTSFLLKTMEKVLDNHIRSGVLKQSPLHPHQHAYQAGKSTTTALHSLVLGLEKAVEDKETALCAFLDIEGAFDNTSFEAIENAATKRGIEPSLVKWIKAMLGSRRITANLGGDSITVVAAKGCPQGGVLSPLLWSLVVDDLLQKLTNSGYDNQGYADDLVITIRGKHDRIISDLMQNALNIVRDWCQTMGLRANPGKTVIVPFTRKRKLYLQAPSLEGTVVEFSKEVKYLGITLDSRLTWNSFLKRVLEKATMATWTCRRLFGRTWGLKPKMTLWSYTSIIRPMVTYASLVWWPKTKQKTAQASLQKLQRLACLGVTGAMRTCPTAALEAILDLLPLHLHVRKEAILSAIRLQRANLLSTNNLVGHLKVLQEFLEDPMANPISDVMPKRHNFETPFKVILGDRQQWHTGDLPFEKGSLKWYTDGSKMEGRAGVGIYGPKCHLAKALGASPTIFQAEIHAIELCAREIIHKNMRGAKIYIISDSQAALKALNSFTFESKLVWDCLTVLKQLAEANKVTLIWVPGHEGIKGNEIADRLAKEGARSPFIGPEPVFGHPKSHLSAQIRLWEDRIKMAHWENTPGLRQAKKFVKYSQQRTKVFLTLSRKELRLITGLFTGHCPLRYHLKKMGKVDDETCRFCMEDDETAEHVLCDCEALGRIRLRHLGKAFPLPEDVAKMAPKNVIGFVKDLKFEWAP